MTRDELEFALRRLNVVNSNPVVLEYLGGEIMAHDLRQRQRIAEMGGNVDRPLTRDEYEDALERLSAPHPDAYDYPGPVAEGLLNHDLKQRSRIASLLAVINTVRIVLDPETLDRDADHKYRRAFRTPRVDTRPPMGDGDEGIDWDPADRTGTLNAIDHNYTPPDEDPEPK